MGIRSKLRKLLRVASTEEILALHQVNLLATAHPFDLWEKGGRAASARALDDLFFEIVKILEPSLFVEAGAKMAEASFRVRKNSERIRIVAFEASPENFNKFSIELPFESKNIEYKHAAVSDKSGTVTFYNLTEISGEKVWNNFGASSILQRHDACSKYTEVTVPSISLDGQFNKPERCVIWVDVEGANEQVIVGGQKFFSRAEAVLIETSYEPIWYGEWTASKVIAEFFDLGLIPVARDFEYIRNFNILFVRRSLLINNLNLRTQLEHYHSVLAKCNSQAT